MNQPIHTIEVQDRSNGRTTRHIMLDINNPFAMASYFDETLSNDSIITLGRVYRYAAHIFDSIEWTPTDNGDRARIIYGGYLIYFYR